MKTLSHFVGTTILGGILFLTPIVVLAFVLSKAFEFVSRGLKPVAALMPDRLASAPTATAILSIFVLALLCFLSGLLAQTRLAQRFVRGLEGSVLSMLPGYEYLKQAGTSVLGFGETRSTRLCSRTSATLGGSGSRPITLAKISSLCSCRIRRTPCPGRSSSSQPTGSVPGGIARLGDRLPEAVRNGGGYAPERRLLRRVERRIRNSPQLAVPLDHEDVVERAGWSSGGR